MENGYQIIKPIREMCVFARQNLFADPPFSRLDLISCRNVLIYLDSDLQRKVIATFHFALRPEGYLDIGSFGEPAALPGPLFARSTTSTSFTSGSLLELMRAWK